MSPIPPNERFNVYGLLVHARMLRECSAVWWQPSLRLPRLMLTAAS